jgi:hypothetical protein
MIQKRPKNDKLHQNFNPFIRKPLSLPQFYFS